MNTINILGLKISNINVCETLDIINQSIKDKNKITFFTPNADFAQNAIRQPYLKKIINSADYLVPDGIGLFWGSKFLNTPFKERISGSSLFFLICESAQKTNYSIYLLGGNKGVAEKAAINLRKKFPGINIVGTYFAPHGFENNAKENEKILMELKDKKPDILIVGLGNFQGERWLIKHKEEIECFLKIQLGASITFAAGDKKMPPELIKRIGLARLWIILQEPRRRWREAFEILYFFYYLLQQKMFNKHV